MFLTLSNCAKIFITGGDILLELNNRTNSDGSESWVPVTKKVYWPPPGPVKAESSPSVHSGKFFILSTLFYFFILDMIRWSLKSSLEKTHPSFTHF